MPGYGKITTRIFNLDPITEFDAVLTGLRLGKRGHEATYAEIIDALEEAEDTARRAHALWCHAKVALESFEIDATVSESAMLTNARTALAQQKAVDSGVSVAQAAVEAYAKTHNVDEYRDLAVRRQKAKRTTDHLEQLAAIWRDRRRTLETMANRVR